MQSEEEYQYPAYLADKVLVFAERRGEKRRPRAEDHYENEGEPRDERQRLENYPAPGGLFEATLVFSMDIPVMYDRYAGISGRTQGEKKERRPAEKAIK